MWTTHGGRVSSPVVDGDQVIVSGLMFLWGEHSGGAHRYVSFDTKTGQVIWMSAPGGPADRHHLRQPVHRRGERHAAAVLGRQRRRHARHQGRHRRSRLELAREPARSQHRGPPGRIRHHRHAQRGERRHEPDGHGGRDTCRFEGHADRRGRPLDRARRAGGLLVAGERRRAAVRARQRRGAVRLRREDRRAALEPSDRDHRQGVTGAGRRQAVHRHGEHRGCGRQVLHHPADRRGSGDPRRRLARHAGDLRAHHRLAGGRARAHLSHVDGRDLRDWSQGRRRRRTTTRSAAPEPRVGDGGGSGTAGPPAACW
jgi:hypothetical protein